MPEHAGRDAGCGDRTLPVWWPIHQVRRRDAPARIILSDDAPLLLDEGA
jgi:hypothetical protein